MRPIVIKDTNKEKIEKAIKEAEGRATSRTIDYDIVKEVCDDVTKTLNLSGKFLDGTQIEVDYFAEKMPRSYKYAAHSTQFVAKFYSNAWHIIDVKRDYLTNSSYKAIHVILSDSAKEGIMRNYTFMNCYAAANGSHYGFNF